MVGHTEHHCWCHADRLMDATQIVVSKEQRDRRLMVPELFREAVRHACEPPRLHADCQIGALDIACADTFRAPDDPPTIYAYYDTR